jgi:hypothetical protein
MLSNHQKCASSISVIHMKPTRSRQTWLVVIIPPMLEYQFRFSGKILHLCISHTTSKKKQPDDYPNLLLFDLGASCIENHLNIKNWGGVSSRVAYSRSCTSHFWLAQRSLSTSRVKPICILLIALFPSFSPLSKFSRNRLCQPTTIDTRHRGPVGVPTRTINMEVL